MKPSWKMLTTAAAVSVLCAPAYSSSPVAYSPRANTKKTKAATQSSPSWVKLRAETNETRYTTGQPIRVQLTATNTHKRGAYLRFSSGQRFDFSVSRAGETNPVYTWSATRMFISALGSLWLKPGQSQSYEAEIGDEMGQLKPGKYTLRARLANSPRPIVAPPVNFEISDLKLSMTAKTDKTTYKIGEPVQIDVAVSNRAPQANQVRFDSGLGCDVRISDEADNVIWTYGANLRFIRVLGNVVWEKGETKNYSATWNGDPLPTTEVPAKLKPGRYRVQAVLQSTPLLYAPPVYIEISE